MEDWYAGGQDRVRCRQVGWRMVRLALAEVFVWSFLVIYVLACWGPGVRLWSLMNLWFGIILKIFSTPSCNPIIQVHIDR